MKRILSGLLGSFALCLALAATARGGFQVEPIGPEYRDSIRKQFGAGLCSYLPDLTSDKLPPGAHNARLGRCALDLVHPVLFAAYASKEGAPLDTLVFDLNGDGDLRNDPVFSGFKSPESKNVDDDALIFDVGSQREIELAIPQGGTPRKFSIMLLSDFMVINSHLWLKGKVRLNEKEVDAALISQNPALGIGAEENPSVFLLLDLNGDGKFDTEGLNSMGRMSREMFSLQSALSVQGSLYKTRFDVVRMDLALTRYTGPQGRLALQPEFACKIKAWSFRGNFGKPDQGDEMPKFVLWSDGRDFPVAMKAQKTLLMSGLLFVTLESGREQILSFSADEPLTIEAGKTATLRPGKFRSFDIAADQDHDSLTISRDFVGANGISYNRVLPATENEKYDGGKVSIFDAQGKQIGEGALEYG
jgi:hypothetical protein